MPVLKNMVSNLGFFVNIVNGSNQIELPSNFHLFGIVLLIISGYNKTVIDKHIKVYKTVINKQSIIKLT